MDQIRAISITQAPSTPVWIVTLSNRLNMLNNRTEYKMVEGWLENHFSDPADYAIGFNAVFFDTEEDAMIFFMAFS